MGTGVGLGHVTRCASLALELRALGARDIRFLLPSGAEERRVLRGLGMAASALHPAAVLPSACAYVVDLGLPKAHWPFRFAGRPAALVAIDDRGLVRRSVDVVVNQNANADPRWYDEIAARCIGPRYALLRPEFTRARGRPRRIRDHGRSVVVSFGGSDPVRGTERAMRAVASLDLEVRVIVSRGFDRVVASPAGSVARFRLSRDPVQMAPFFLSADLAIVAGGSTLYELAACGTPALVLSVNREQEAHASRLERLGAVESLGLAEAVEAKALSRAVVELLGDASRRRALSRAGRKLVDGRGAHRVATSLFRAAGFGVRASHGR